MLKSFTELLDSPLGINACGEFLRNLFFEQSEGVGCHETFKLRPHIEILPEMKVYIDGSSYVYTHARTSVGDLAIHMSHNNETNLAFSVLDVITGRFVNLINRDRQKEYMWDCFFSKERQKNE